jgi:hypothetical protein
MSQQRTVAACYFNDSNYIPGSKYSDVKSLKLPSVVGFVDKSDNAMENSKGINALISNTEI